MFCFVLFFFKFCRSSLQVRGPAEMRLGPVTQQQITSRQMQLQMTGKTLIMLIIIQRCKGQNKPKFVRAICLALKNWGPSKFIQGQIFFFFDIFYTSGFEMSQHFRVSCALGLNILLALAKFEGSWSQGPPYFDLCKGGKYCWVGHSRCRLRMNQLRFEGRSPLMTIFPGSMDKLPVNDFQMTVKNLLNIAE